MGVCREEGRLSRRWGWEWLEQRNRCIQGPWGFSVAGGCCVHSGCILPQPSSPQREVGGQSGRGGPSSGARASMWLGAQGSWREDSSRKGRLVQQPEHRIPQPVPGDPSPFGQQQKPPHSRRTYFWPKDLVSNGLRTLVNSTPLRRGLLNSCHWAHPPEGLICLHPFKGKGIAYTLFQIIMI